MNKSTRCLPMNIEYSCKALRQSLRHQQTSPSTRSTRVTKKGKSMSMKTPTVPVSLQPCLSPKSQQPVQAALQDSKHHPAKSKPPPHRARAR